jgi:hypothetical protein
VPTPSPRWGEERLMMAKQDMAMYPASPAATGVRMTLLPASATRRRAPRTEWFAQSHPGWFMSAATGYRLISWSAMSSRSSPT